MKSISLTVTGPKAIKKFLSSVIALLALTATAKFISAFGSAEILKILDPVFELSFRAVLLLAGAVEILVIITLLKTRKLWIQLALIFTLASCFSVYRIAVKLIQPGQYCPCFGTVTDALGIPYFIIDWFLKGVIAYFWFGSLWLIIKSDPEALFDPNEARRSSRSA